MTPLNSPQKRALAWLGIAALGLLLLWLLGPVLMPFIVSGVLAYALQPAVEWLVRRRLPRALAVGLVIVLTLFAFLAVVLLLVPILTKQLPMLQAQIPVLAERLNASLLPWLARLGIDVSLDVASIREFALKYLSTNGEEWSAKLLQSARIGGSFLLALIGNAVLIPVVLFYLLMDWNRLTERWLSFVPPRARAGVMSFLAECDELLGQYLRGQLSVVLILAAFYAIGLQLAGFSLAWPIGVFTGLAMFIPYLGFGLGLILALLAAVLQFPGWYGVGAVAVVYGVGQVIESAFLTPRLVGERIGLHPVVVIFALLAFGQLFGFLGILVALPLSAVLLVAARRVEAHYRASRLYTG